MLPRGLGPHPAIVLVHGSGPGDRDESIGPNGPFRDLAEGLASRGIAVLRYDKRTKVYPQAMAALPMPTVKDETIDDAAAAVGLLRGRDDIDPRRIILAGHSLGATLAPRIAAANPTIGAIVLLAAATQPLPDIMVEQVAYLDSLSDRPAADRERDKTAAEVEATRARAAQRGESGPLIFGVQPSYWGDLNDYDPAATAATLNIPILILQGARDYQVRPSNLDRFRSLLSGRPNVEIHELANLNHLFMTGSGPGRPQEHDVPSHVDAKIIDMIAAFIDRIPAP